MDLQFGTYRPGAYLGSRPLMVNSRKDPTKKVMAVNKHSGMPMIVTNRGLQVNSLLRASEWATLDAAVQTAARTRLKMLNLFRTRGLVKPLSSFGTLISEYSKSSEVTGASKDMTGRGRPDRDLPEFTIAGVPVPIIWKDVSIPVRQLEASRLAGNALDTSATTEAARVVAEAIEDMITNGDASVIFGGYTLYGLTSETNRNTGSATGDWGTISNIQPTIAAMIAALNGDRYFGPYVLQVATTQYTQMTTSVYSDGSGQSAYTRALQTPELEAITPNDSLADGSLVMSQVTEDVSDYVEHMDITVVEWMSPDMMTNNIRVMAVGAPRIKADSGSRSGVAHFTGA